MTKLTLEQQELLFANDCKLINLRYEYHGYTGTEKWAIVTELAEEELWVKYPDVIRRYTPFILLSMAQGEVIDESYRNNDKYEKRAKRTIDVYGYAKVLLPHFSCHSLRHTFTTRMCEAGVNVKVIQDTLGHKDISTTLNIYTDVTKELRRSEFEGLDSYFKNEYNKANEVL
jgi:integrase